MQAVEWLGELLEALLKTHLRLGDDAQDTSALIDKHTKFIDVAQVSGNRVEAYSLAVGCSWSAVGQPGGRLRPEDQVSAGTNDLLGPQYASVLSSRTRLNC